MQSAQWYSWGPPNMQCRLCVSCWMYWKKYGGLKMPSRAEAPEERTSPSPASNVSSVRRQRCKTQGMLWGEEGDSDKHQGVCSSSKHVYIHLTSAFWRNSASQPTIESTPFAKVSFDLHEVRIYCFTVSFSQMHILHTYCFFVHVLSAFKNSNMVSVFSSCNRFHLVVTSEHFMNGFKHSAVCIPVSCGHWCTFKIKYILMWRK